MVCVGVLQGSHDRSQSDCGSEALVIYAIVVDAKDEQVQAFYEHFGFIGLPGAKRRLFYPVAGID